MRAPASGGNSWFTAWANEVAALAFEAFHPFPRMSRMPLGVGVILLNILSAVASQPSMVASWGLDACIPSQASDATLAADFGLLESSSVSVLREREPGPHLAKLKERGYSVLAFAPVAPATSVSRFAQLPTDLLEVYEQARQLAIRSTSTVDGWEMIGEPDTGYCHDLPDRLAAYQKAQYLGLKAGGAPLVLMGALGLPPGPWLERAVANDLLQYTDAYNFHYYGYARDLSGIITAHSAIARKEHALPLWITECGMNAMIPGADFDVPRRSEQAKFTLETAKIALAAADVAVFMPFIFSHPRDPYSLIAENGQPFPGWTAYAAFTRSHIWPRRRLTRSPQVPSKIVVQWLPDSRTSLPHKIAGSYRFRSTAPISGRLVLYNFSASSSTVHSEIAPMQWFRFKTDLLSSTIVPAFGKVVVPLNFSSLGSRRAKREIFAANFEDATGVSHLSFTVEQEGALVGEQVAFIANVPWEGIPTFPTAGKLVADGAWCGANGVGIKDLNTGAARENASTHIRVWAEHLTNDPLHPPCLAAHGMGLREGDILEVQMSGARPSECEVSIYLIDNKGQRFTIWENQGVDYFNPSELSYTLDLRDFGLHFWGRCSDDIRFKPSNIREMQIRPHLRKNGQSIEITVKVIHPRGHSDESRQ